MANLQAHVTIPYFTALPEDVVTNVWSFSFVLNPVAGDWNNLRDDLEQFYEDILDGVGSAMVIAPWMRPALSTMKGYDLADPIPRAPVYTSNVNMTMTAVTTSALPPEMAVCLSFQGAPISGQPQARRRGRIFIGGIGTGPTVGSASLFPNVSSVTRTAIGAAATAFKAAALADGWTWCVWSRTDAQMVPVANGWVDDALDTQRRRGQAATARTTWS